MAYAEKRGKGPEPWRVKYKRPDGSEGSESGFETKAAALAWGRDQEAKVRSGTWINPDAGKVLVSAWIEQWTTLQDVGLSTTSNREYLIRRFILPAWAKRELDSLRDEEINKWERGLPGQLGVSGRTASDARSLLCTILGDAVAAKPPLLARNPALRPRNRGRRTGRKLARSPQRVWATPLEVLLLAERAALLSGHASDFTLLIAIAYTGLRWGETIGLERDYLRRHEIRVEWQLREIGGAFHRIPPKDDSYRSPKWEPCLPVDIPDFLGDLLARQSSEGARQRCTCFRSHGGSGYYVFLGADGGHHRRSNYARRVFRPACDGRLALGSNGSSRTVIADAVVWPGVPLATWPSPPQGIDSYEQPRGRGIRVIPASAAPSCWLPIKVGLTPHGLRHSHKTWMTEDGIPEILAEQRLGHDVPGMRGLYAHVSDAMRGNLKTALQARWEASLRARIAIHPQSPFPLLNQLLAHVAAAAADD